MQIFVSFCYLGWRWDCCHQSRGKMFELLLIYIKFLHFMIKHPPASRKAHIQHTFWQFLTRAQRSPSSAPHTGWTRGRSRCNKSKMRCPDWHSAACPRFAVSQGSGRVHLRCHCVSMVTAEPGGWRFLEGWSQRRHHRGWCNSRCTFLPEVPSRPRL